MEEIRYPLVCEDSGRKVQFQQFFFFFDCKLSSDIRSSSLICSVALVEMMQNTWQEGNRLALVQTQHMKMY